MTRQLSRATKRRARLRLISDVVFLILAGSGFIALVALVR
jgi:hypothetical protein